LPVLLTTASIRILRSGWGSLIRIRAMLPHSRLGW
jgi:hypothetical protein